MSEPRFHPRLFQMLRFALLARCILDLVFAWRIHRVADVAFVDLADAFAPFALLDGIVAFIVAIIAFAAWLPRAIVVLAATDAMLRLAAANALHFGPGISYFPMTIVLYIGLLAAFVLAFGIAEAVEAVQIERQLGRNPLSIALGIASVATVALAVAQFSLLHVPSALKNLLTIGIALQGLSMLAVAAGARNSTMERSS